MSTETHSTLQTASPRQDGRRGGEVQPHQAEILRLFALTGVAIKQQVARGIGLPEKEAGDLLEDMVAGCALESAGRGPLLERVRLARSHWQKRGALPIVYRLGAGGAALLRAETGQDIRACRLAAPDQVGHALHIVDAALKVRELGLEVQVERVVNFPGGTIRMDLLVTLPQGYLDIEVEQMVGPDHIPRLRELLAHRRAFFESAQSDRFVPWILVLVNAGRTDWPRMQRLWRQALASLPAAVPFQVWATTLARFAECQKLEERSGWTDLTDPLGLDQESQKTRAATRTLPARLQRSTDLPGDKIVLAAFVQQFGERAAQRVTDLGPFCDLIETIAGPSLWTDADGPTGMEMPLASLYLLRRYLEMNPDLHQALQRRLMDGAELHRWGAANVTARIKSVARVFLAYFGLSPDGRLSVRVHLPEQDGEADEFHVRVEVTGPWPGTTEAGLPNEYAGPEPQRFEEALAFVLHLILRYPEELGIRRPPYA